jgi:hypothetical protein
MPPNLGGDPSKPIGGTIITFMQPIIPYFGPYKKPFNYPKYKKDSNLDAHV